jgi:glycosyltransferase involved in cell wall biosynthesis
MSFEMKVAYVLTTGRGGLPHYTAELANAVSNYAEVTVIKPAETTADDVFSDKIGIINAFKSTTLSYVDIYKSTAFSFKNIKGLLSYRKINVVDEIKPDIIHFPGGIFPHALIFAKLHKLDRKYPIVLTFHDVLPKKLFMLPRKDMPTGEPLLSVIVVNIANLLKKVIPEIRVTTAIVHTNKNRERLVERGINPEKIAVIPHGAYQFFKGYDNNKEEGENCILFFGNIVMSKALDVLIDAVTIVREEIPDIKLIIAGDGVIPKRSRIIIEKYKANFEIHNYFIPNEKVGGFFKRASIVVIPNRRQEGHSGSLTVAHSFGKPVVTTNVGEFPSLVRDAGCGLVVPPEDSEALAEAILKLLKDAELRKQMGENALRKAEELSWDNIAKLHMKVYEEVLNERAKRD